MNLLSGRTRQPCPWHFLIAPLLAALLSITCLLAQTSAAANPISVSIISPTQGQVLTASGTAPPPNSGVLISARSSAGTITGISVTINGAFLGSGTLLPGSRSTYLVPWYTVNAGLYTFVATATDSTGTQTASIPVTVAMEEPGCAVNYVVSTQWSSGFTASIAIKSGVYVSSWALSFTFPGQQTVTQGWGGTFSQQGNKVTITNAPYDGSFLPGGTVTVGFNANNRGGNFTPTSFLLNAVTPTASISDLCALGTMLIPPP